MDSRSEVADAARRLAAEGLLIGTAGNVSVRDGDTVAITASGIRLAACEPADVTLVSLTGDVLDGRLAPSSEVGLHLGIYRAGAAGAVVHTHAPYATAAACVLDELPVLHYQQLALGGTIRVAEYATFGTDDLARATLAALDGRSAALLANHGSVAIGATMSAAVDNALLLEWLAALHQRALTFGAPRPLTEQQQRDVIDQAIARNYGTPQENR